MKFSATMESVSFQSGGVMESHIVLMVLMRLTAPKSIRKELKVRCRLKVNVLSETCTDASVSQSLLLIESRCNNLYHIECGPLDSGCYNNHTQRCDGHRDCRQSGLDEDGCGGCSPGSMPCYTHGCYRISQTCDGIPDCQDYTDEADCGGWLPIFNLHCRVGLSSWK